MVAIRALVVLAAVCAASVTCRHHAREDLPADLAAEAPAAAAEEPQGADPERRRHRRKRWYSGYGYGQPAVYRDDAPPGPPAPPFDPFAYIYRRLDELALLLRQPPPPQQAPILVPYPLYLPAGACGCPVATVPVPGPAAESNATIPEFPNRVKPNEEDDYDDEPIRPISFEPVKPDRPLSRPVPGVEHGSSQAGAGAAAAPPQQQGRLPPAAAAVGAQAPPAQAAAPSRCDLAVLTCCHQRYTTNQCFVNLGCPTALRSANPCDSRTLTNVVSVFQNFYAQS